MITVFLIIFVGFLWSVVNFIDTYLISKRLQGGGVGAIVIFSSIIGLFMLPVLYIINPDVLKIESKDALILISTGIIFATTWLIPYFYALKEDDTSLVIGLFQLISVITYLLGYFILGEKLSNQQLIGMFIIIIGAVLLSIDPSNLKFKKKVFGLMFICTLSVAICTVLFKFASNEVSNFTVSLFWEHIGIAIMGMIYSIFFKSFRDQFLILISKNKRFIVSLNVLNELISVAAKGLVYFIALSSFASFAWLSSASQSFLVLIFGSLLTKAFPHLFNEKLEKRVLLLKITSIIIMFIGTTILFTASNIN